MTQKAELLIADAGMNRFIREQYSSNLGYPKMAAFARNVSRGTVSLPPTLEDPFMECVGAFYHSLRPIERRILVERYMIRDKVKACVKRLSMSVGSFYRKVTKLLWRCYDWMRARGHA